MVSPPSPRLASLLLWHRTRPKPRSLTVLDICKPLCAYKLPASGRNIVRIRRHAAGLLSLPQYPISLFFGNQRWSTSQFRTQAEDLVIGVASFPSRLNWSLRFAAHPDPPPQSDFSRPICVLLLLATCAVTLSALILSFGLSVGLRLCCMSDQRGR